MPNLVVAALGDRMELSAGSARNRIRRPKKQKAGLSAPLPGPVVTGKFA